VLGDGPGKELKKLKVVALIQNDEDRKILQAIQADVPAPRE
jgi:hypothetical protein